MPKPSFNSPGELENKFFDYINYCKAEEVPNIIGFCRYCGIHRDTYYEYKNNKPEYSDTIKRIETVLEDVTVQKLFSARNPAGVIFYLKNKFGWVDKQEITVDDKRVMFVGEDKIPD